MYTIIGIVYACNIYILIKNWYNTKINSCQTKWNWLLAIGRLFFIGILILGVKFSYFL